MSCNQEIAVSVRDLKKSYKVFDSVQNRLMYYLFRKKTGTEFLALNDISFEVYKGETFGIIGKNGSGKSTMLQIMAGILKPTSGSIEINGKIAALLELGSGFNPENTGYENIYMNAAVLGITKDAIENKIDDIIRFADIGDFLYQPVKTYSSGMYIRLAFAVAINVDADIILIDEALAVGDVFFRQKCYAKLNELKAQGKTIILVSHGMGEVEQFCDRALLLMKGKQIIVDRSTDVVKRYYLEAQKSSNSLLVTSDIDNIDYGEVDCFFSSQLNMEKNWTPKEEQYLNLNNQLTNGKASIVKVGIYDELGESKNVFEQGEWAYFYFEFKTNEQINVPIVGILLRNDRNIIVHGKNSMQTTIDTPTTVPSGAVIQVVQAIQLSLEQGEYTYEVGLTEMESGIYSMRNLLNNEELFGAEQRIAHCSSIGMFSVIEKKYGNPTKLSHHGICDLNTKLKLKIC